MNSNHDDQNDSVRQNAAVKLDGAYQPSGHDDKDSRAESCGCSQHARPYASEKDRTGNFTIIDSGRSFRIARAVSGLTSSQQLSQIEKEKLRKLLIRMRTELLNEFGPDYEMLNSDPVLGADMRCILEPSLDINNRHPLLWI